MEESIDNYLKTIEINGDAEYYFAPNAALQLGYIYQEKENYVNAEKYFRKALSYPSHEYKNSIDHKAKAALASLKNK